MLTKEMEKRIKKQISTKKRTGNWYNVHGIHKGISGYGSGLKASLNVKTIKGDVSGLWGGDDSKISGDVSMFSGDITGIVATSREISRIINKKNNGK